MHESYLTTRTSREEVEQRFDFAKASDVFREFWEKLFSNVQPGDELWNFAPSSGEAAYQLRGIALVRAGKPVSFFVTAIGQEGCTPVDWLR